jgi:hypothetical protein
VYKKNVITTGIQKGYFSWIAGIGGFKRIFSAVPAQRTDEPAADP